MDAPRFPKLKVPLAGVIIALVIALVLYATLAFANYNFGGHILRGNLRSLGYALPAPFFLALAIIAIAAGIRKMHEEQRAWHTQPIIFMGIGYTGMVLALLVLLEGLGNDIFSPLVGLSLAGLFFVFSIACMICSVIFPGRARKLPESSARL